MIAGRPNVKLIKSEQEDPEMQASSENEEQPLHR